MDVDQPSFQSNSASSHNNSGPGTISAPNSSSTVSSMFPAPTTPSPLNTFNSGAAFPTSIPNFPTPGPLSGAIASPSTTPLITPGSKRKRSYFQQDGEEDYLAGVVQQGDLARIDEGSAVKAIRTQAPRPAAMQLNTSPLPFGSGFAFGQVVSTPAQDFQSINGDPLGALGHLDGNGTGANGNQDGMDVEMDMQTSDQAHGQTSAASDYFNRSIAALPGSANGGAAVARRTSTLSLCGNNMNPNITTMSLPSTPATSNDPPFMGDGMQVDEQLFAMQQQQKMVMESGIGVQAFSTDLQPPPSRVGLMQPFVHDQDADGMGEGGVAGQVQQTRTAHGPHCKTIPRLVLSDHPDPSTGKRSMWTMCSSCGSVEMVPS